MADAPSANKMVKVTPADATDVGDHKGVWIMDAGDVSVIINQGESATGAVTVPAGFYIPGRVYSIENTATTCSHIYLVF